MKKKQKSRNCNGHFLALLRPVLTKVKDFGLEFSEVDLRR